MTIGATPEELIERHVELEVAAEFIADEHADVLRPKQTEQLYAMRALLESLISDRAKLREALGDARCRFLFFESMIGISGTAARHAENGIKRIDAALNITKGQSNDTE